MKEFGIYKIINTIDQKSYIGSTVRSFKQRWSYHKYTFKRQANSRYLQNAWDKYGEENFSFEIVEVLTDKSLVLEREQYWIDLLKPEYNLAPVAGTNIGCRHSEEEKKRKGQATKKLWQDEAYRLKQLERLSGVTNPFYGKAHSHESRNKISENSPFSKEFSFISPTGDIFSGSNIAKFAKSKNLCPRSMQRVIRGKAQAYKGWRKL